MNVCMNENLRIKIYFFKEITSPGGKEGLRQFGPVGQWWWHTSCPRSLGGCPALPAAVLPTHPDCLVVFHTYSPAPFQENEVMWFSSEWEGKKIHILTNISFTTWEVQRSGCRAESKPKNESTWSSPGSTASSPPLPRKSWLCGGSEEGRTAEELPAHTGGRMKKVLGTLGLAGF